MARIYNGFNALGIGQAINGVNDSINRQRMTGLDSLARGFNEYFSQKNEAAEAARKRKSAMDYLTGNGMDNAKAAQMVETITPEQAVLYLTGRIDKKADTKSEHEYEQSIYNRNRADAQEDKILDNAYAWEDWVRKHDIGEKDRIAFEEFNNINSMITALQMKVQSGSLPSKQDIEEMNQLKSMRNEWIKQHPNFSQIMFASGMGDSSANPFESKESAMAALKALIGNDGFVDPKGLNDLNTQFLWQTGRNLFNDPEYKDTYNHLAKRQRGSKNKRNAQNPEGAGIVTQFDLEKIDKDANEMARLGSLHKSIMRWLAGKGEKPEVSENDLNILEDLENNNKFGRKGAVVGYRRKMRAK